MTSQGFEGQTTHGIQIGMQKSDDMEIIDESALLSSEKKPTLSEDHWILNGMNIDFRNDKCSVFKVGIQNYILQKD
jgi:hypothetical protein